MQRLTPWVAALALATVAGCEGDEPPTGPREGIWSSPLATLEVADGKVVSFRLERITCAAVNPEPECGLVGPLPIDNLAIPIKSDAFSLSSSALDVEGSFATDMASGAYVFRHSGGCCVLDGRWFAFAPAPDDGTCADTDRVPEPQPILIVGETDVTSGDFAAWTPAQDVDVIMGFQGLKMVVMAVQERDLAPELQRLKVEIRSQDGAQLFADFQLKRPPYTTLPDGMVQMSNLPVVVTATNATFVDQPAVVRVFALDPCGLSFAADPVDVVLRKAF